MTYRDRRFIAKYLRRSAENLRIAADAIRRRAGESWNRNRDADLMMSDACELLRIAEELMMPKKKPRL